MYSGLSFINSIDRAIEIDRIDVEKFIWARKGEIDGAPASMCSAPENRDRFLHASMEQTLSSTSIDRAIDRVKYSQPLGWPG